MARAKKEKLARLLYTDSGELAAASPPPTLVLSAASQSSKTARVLVISIIIIVLTQDVLGCLFQLVTLKEQTLTLLSKY